MRKRFFAALLTAVLLLMCTVPCFALVGKSPSFYVADYADVLSDTLENRIVSINGELEFYCNGSQMVVVSVDYLDGLYSDEYAMTLFNDWGVGSRDHNNGTLLLLCPNENKAWLTYGSGLEGALTSSRVDDLFDSVFWDPFDSGNYETAVDNMVSELVGLYASFYNVSREVLDPSSYQGGSYDYDDGGYVPDTPYYDSDDYSYSSGNRMRPIIFFLVVVLIIYLLIRRADRRRYQSYCGAMGYGIRPYHWWYLFWGPHLHWHAPRPPQPPMNGGYYSSWNHGSHQYGNHSSGNGFGGHSSGSSFGGHSSGSSFGGHSSGFSSHSGSGFGGGGHGGGGGGRR